MFAAEGNSDPKMAVKKLLKIFSPLKKFVSNVFFLFFLSNSLNFMIKQSSNFFCLYCKTATKCSKVILFTFVIHTTPTVCPYINRSATLTALEGVPAGCVDSDLMCSFIFFHLPVVGIHTYFRTLFKFFLSTWGFLYSTTCVTKIFCLSNRDIENWSFLYVSSM